MDLSRIIRPDFDPETHTYRVNGVVMPHVTGLLRDAGLSGDPATGTPNFQIPDEVIGNARERGHYVHEAIELDAQGILDEDSLDDEIYGYLEAWRDFVDDTGYVSIAQEIPCYVPEYGYCCTVDDVGYIGDRLTIIDRKTGSVGLKPWHKYQLAANAWPFVLSTVPIADWPHRMMVWLRPELKRKRYRTYSFSPQTADNDFEVFIACLTIHTAKQSNRLA